jgi:hypothetical protein
MYHMLPRRLLYIAEIEPSKPDGFFFGVGCMANTEISHVEREVPLS